jgi:hypothetical protein
VPGLKDPYANQSTYKDVLNYLRSGQGARRTALYEMADPSSRRAARIRW